PASCPASESTPKISATPLLPSTRQIRPFPPLASIFFQILHMNQTSLLHPHIHPVTLADIQILFQTRWDNNRHLPLPARRTHLHFPPHFLPPNPLTLDPRVQQIPVPPQILRRFQIRPR